MLYEINCFYPLLEKACDKGVSYVLHCLICNQHARPPFRTDQLKRGVASITVPNIHEPNISDLVLGLSLGQVQKSGRTYHSV